MSKVPANGVKSVTTYYGVHANAKSFKKGPEHREAETRDRFYCILQKMGDAYAYKKAQSKHNIYISTVFANNHKTTK